MKVEHSRLPGALILTPRRFEDERGFFSESWNARLHEAAGISQGWVQDNHSFSRQAGTVRGLHFQAPPHAQAKLVRCGHGKLTDVWVDIRRGSPTYGQWDSCDLSFENGRQVLIPAGFLHGFVTREPDTEIIYKCSDYYDPASDGAVRFDSPGLGIDWALAGRVPVLSDKDRGATPWADFASPFTWEAGP